MQYGKIITRFSIDFEMQMILTEQYKQTYYINSLRFIPQHTAKY